MARPALLSRERVAQAAFDLVHTEGSAALTMPRLARELGVGTMTLYGYAASKDEIVGMLPDLLLHDLPAAGTIEEIYLAAYRRLVEHGHVTRLIAGAPVFGRAQARVRDDVVQSLVDQGYAADEAFGVQRTLGTYTLGFAMLTLAAVDTSEAEFLAGLRHILG